MAKRALVEVKAERVPDTSKPVNESGSRFRDNTTRRTAYDIMTKMAKAGKTKDEMLDALVKAGVGRETTFNCVIATHPKQFKLWTDGTVEWKPEKPVPSSGASAKPAAAAAAAPAAPKAAAPKAALRKKE